MEKKTSSFEGALLKKSAWLKAWNSRYFRVRGRTLCYYESVSASLARGEIPLVGASVEAATIPGVSPQQNGMVLHTAKKKEYLLAADTEEEREKWIGAIQAAIDGPPQLRKPVVRQSNSGNGSEIASQSHFAELKPPESWNEAGRKDSEQENSHAFEFSSTFVPPPPPEDATDPLSYLMEIETPQPTRSKRKSNVEVEKQKKREEIGSLDMSSLEPESAPQRQATAAETLFVSTTDMIDETRAEGKEMNPSGIGLRNAIKAGDRARVKQILDAEPSLAQWIDGQGSTMLHVAAMFQRLEICMDLMDAGADPSAMDNQNETALDVAPVTIRAKMEEKMQDKFR